MPALDLAHYKELLLDLRERLRDEMEERVESVQQVLKATGEVPNLSTHRADRDTEGIDSEVAVGAAQQRIRDAVREALERLEAGTYGTCEECRGEIAADRLEAIPYARYCMRCEAEIERLESEGGV